MKIKLIMKSKLGQQFQLLALRIYVTKLQCWISKEPKFIL